jgi:transcriptional regulator of acetoin/glycerol metabolism
MITIKDLASNYPFVKTLFDALPCEYFISEFSTDSWTPKLTLAPEAGNILMNYFWPGNVREPRNVLQYACVRATSEVITPADLPPNLRPSDTPKINSKKKRRLLLTDSRVDEALEMAQGNRQEAAKILGVSRSTLYRFFEKQ